MATILEKDLVRESTVKIDGVPLVVTIKANQSVDMKLKGVRGGVLNIPLLELWEYLGGSIKPSESEESEEPKKGTMVAIKKTTPQKGDNKMISLYDLRSANAISVLDMPTKVKFDELISDMIKNLKIE